MSVFQAQDNGEVILGREKPFRRLKVVEFKALRRTRMYGHRGGQDH